MRYKDLVKGFDVCGVQVAQCPVVAETCEAARTQVDWDDDHIISDVVCVPVAVVGEVVKLPARNSKAFAALPPVVRELLHSAHRLQFALRTGAARYSGEQLNAMRAGLLRCLELAQAVVMDAMIQHAEVKR